MRSPWDPRQYERFHGERRQPFQDLLGLLEPVAGGRVVDLGCGTGELTAELHRALGARETLGIDRSETMLARSGALAAPGLSFAQLDVMDFAARDAGTEQADRRDLLFSNACLQWIPDHAVLLERLAALLAPGGQLAFQVPANHGHATHRLAATVAAEEPFASGLAGAVKPATVLAPERYAELLHALGFEMQRVELRVYPHLLPSREEVVEWVRGTLLTWYQERLPEEMWLGFLERYREVLFGELADERPFFHPFPRILAWGRLGG